MSRQSYENSDKTTPKPQSSVLTPQSAYEPRFPNRNAGFIFIGISLFVSYAIFAIIIIGIANNPSKELPNPGFNWAFTFITFGVALGLFAISMLIAERLLRNTPRRIILEAELLKIEDEKGQVLAQIPYSQILHLDEADTVLSEGQYNARYRGLVVTWQEADQAREFLLSARNTRDFEEMMDDLFPRVAEIARGPRTFDR